MDKYFHLGKNLNQGDTIAVWKMVGGFHKNKWISPQMELAKEVSIEVK